MQQRPYCLFIRPQPFYNLLHRRLKRLIPKTHYCLRCQRRRKTYYANVSGYYQYVRTDYIELCGQCHFRLDHYNGKDFTGYLLELISSDKMV